MTPDGHRGFTLIELLIVVVIIGVLAAIAIPRFSTVRDRSYISAMASDLKNLAHQQEIYYNANYAFSSNLTDLGATETEGVTITINEADNDGWAATAAHAAIPSEQCGIYHGDADASNGQPASQPSTVQCSM